MLRERSEKKKFDAMLMLSTLSPGGKLQWYDNKKYLGPDDISNPFVEKSEIVFNATKGLTLFINATELKQISGYEFPLRLIFEPTPPSISIQRFKPIFK